MTAPADVEFGRRVREAREARGVSLRQIANSTKISTSVLEALEGGDFSKLPAGIFGRAFVRSYAQEVGLDPDETVQEFVELTAVELRFGPSPIPTRPGEEGESLFESQRRMAGVAFRLVLISVPIAVLLLYFTLARSRPVGTVPVSGTPPTASVPARAARVETTLPPAVPTPAPASPPAAVDRVDTPVPASDASADLPSANEGFLLEVQTTGPCWVSLTVDGSVVLSKVMSAEEKVARRVKTGALIQVGDAGVFGFSLNGQPARPLGEAGQVRSVQITRANYASFLR